MLEEETVGYQAAGPVTPGDPSYPVATTAWSTVYGPSVPILDGPGGGIARSGAERAAKVVTQRLAQDLLVRRSRGCSPREPCSV